MSDNSGILSSIESNDFLLMFEDDENIRNLNYLIHDFSTLETNEQVSSDYSNVCTDCESIEYTSEVSSNTYELLYCDSLLPQNELKFLEDILNNTDDDLHTITSVSDSDEDNTMIIRRNNKRRKVDQKLIISNNLSKIRISLTNFGFAVQNFFLSNNIDGLSQIMYDIMDLKCLVRFKINNISARTGPKSLLDYFTLKKKAFPDIHKSNHYKSKEFMADRFFVFKAKVTLYGTESSFEDTFQFFSQCFNVDDITHLNNRKYNFIPNQYRIEVIVTRYIDKFTGKIVLWDLGFRIKSQIALISS